MALKTAYPKIGIWFDSKAGDIHLSIEGHGLSTVSSSTDTRRGHPHLFNKLAKVLRDADLPHPPIVEDGSS